MRNRQAYDLRSASRRNLSDRGRTAGEQVLFAAGDEHAVGRLPLRPAAALFQLYVRRESVTGYVAYRARRPSESAIMRVGILLGNSDPTAGGGYTFQKEVFDALLAIGAQSRHSFVFLCHPDTAAKLPPRPLPNAEVVALDAEVVAQRAILFGRSKPAPKLRTLDQQLQAA